MGGALLQLLAYGAQDAHLSGSPQVTYFKTVFRRATSFAIESVSQQFSGTVRFGSKVSAIISRNGDLLGDTWLEITMTKGSGGTYHPAEAVVESVEAELGGQRIDRHTATWFRIFDNTHRDATERAAYKAMTDFVDSEPVGYRKKFYLPLIFWYTRSPGSYLPLLSLQYHEFRITVQFAQTVAGIDTTAELGAELWCDYAFIEAEERRKFATESHSYLIEQVQYSGDENVSIGVGTKKSTQTRLSLNHPTKAIYWVIADPAVHGRFTGGAAGETKEAFAPLAEARLLLNGQDRAAARSGSYYRSVVPFQTCGGKRPDAGIYMMSFALRPTEATNPSGSLNFSRIDSAVLAQTFKSAKTGATVMANLSTEDETIAATADVSALRTFAVNWNFVRIMSGMGGLSYSS